MTPATTPAACPHLGLTGDRTVIRMAPSDAHRCYAGVPLRVPENVHQETYCLTSRHLDCPFYVLPEHTPQHAAASDGPRRRLALLPWLVLATVVIVVVVAYAGGIFSRSARTQAPDAPNAPLAAALPAATTPLPATGLNPTHTPRPSPSPTPTGAGQLLALLPEGSGAGWWTSADKKGEHLGDSLLYAGQEGEQTFISAVRFDLREVPRGAAIQDGSLVLLTGLNSSRFQPSAGGTWSAQLLSANVIPDLANMSFDGLANATAGVALSPDLYPADLQKGAVNTWNLDANARAWLADQVAQGLPYVILRIKGPAAGKDSVFAWDSGIGPVTSNNGPKLRLALGPAPITTPTAIGMVGSLPSTPENVLTAAADQRTATQVAEAVGTYTPVPVNLITPTPLPPFLQTAVARGYSGQLRPVVLWTPVPANSATVVANTLYATAVAMTTGTFTPVPDNAVTPIIINPTPVPENVMTAMAQDVVATQRARRAGTPTPLPFNAIVATPTLTPFVATHTPTPASAATAQALAIYATAVAYTTGTFTPMPVLWTPTVTPTGTPLPLVLASTARPAPTITLTPPAEVPDVFSGKILFVSDREGAAMLELYALDPATGALSWVTQMWPHKVAQTRDAQTQDRNQTASVEIVYTSKVDKTTGLKTDFETAQIFVQDKRYNTKQQVTHGTRWSYDPAWSPMGDWIAFVSQETGNDEIYVMRPDGSDVRRLTHTTWEWNKHPTWSPDGSQIVFWSNRETGRKQLWIMNADGTSQRRLLDSGFNDWDPIWVK